MALLSGTARSVVWLAALCLVAGVVLVAIAGDGTVRGIGGGLVGVAVVLALALAFYVVGRSEDLDRAQRPTG